MIGGTKRHGAEDHLGDFQARLAEPCQEVSDLQVSQYTARHLPSVFHGLELGDSLGVDV